MDSIDRKILTALQSDATISIAELADRVGLSQTPCWKRIQRLEQQGVILGRVALVSPEKSAEIAASIVGAARRVQNALQEAL